MKRFNKIIVFGLFGIILLCIAVSTKSYLFLTFGITLIIYNSINSIISESINKNSKGNSHFSIFNK